MSRRLPCRVNGEVSNHEQLCHYFASATELSLFYYIVIRKNGPIFVKLQKRSFIFYSQNKYLREGTKSISSRLYLTGGTYYILLLSGLIGEGVGLPMSMFNIVTSTKN